MTRATDRLTRSLRHRRRDLDAAVSHRPARAAPVRPDTAAVKYRTLPRDRGTRATSPTLLLGPDAALLPCRRRSGAGLRRRTPLFNPDAPFTARADAPHAAVRTRDNRPIASSARVAALARDRGAPRRGGGAASRYKFMRQHRAPRRRWVRCRAVESGRRRGVRRRRRRGQHAGARVAVAPGSHILELRGRGVPRVIPLNVTAGAEVSQYLEFAETPVTGQLAVQSEPAGAKVFVDGADRGVAPVTDRRPGAGRSRGRTAERRRRPRGTPSTFRPAAPHRSLCRSAATAHGGSGVRLGFGQGAVLDGNPRAGPTARHDRRRPHHDGRGPSRARARQRDARLSRRRASSGRARQGRRHRARSCRRASINLNAAPWAEVWIDGSRVGETPIGNLSVAIGPHEVVFRHPQFGEKRHAISVTLSAPVRLSVDMK